MYKQFIICCFWSDINPLRFWVGGVILGGWGPLSPIFLFFSSFSKMCVWGLWKIMKNKAAAGSKEIILEGNLLEEVDTFCYLGSMADRTGGTEVDVKARIGKARAAFTQLGKVWRARKISRKTKLRLFNACVKSVLLYGCETWKATATVIKKLQTFVNRCIRRILGVRWMDRVRNEDLWERANQVPMEVEIKRRRCDG